MQHAEIIQITGRSYRLKDRQSGIENKAETGETKPATS